MVCRAAAGRVVCITQIVTGNSAHTRGAFPSAVVVKVPVPLFIKRNCLQLADGRITPEDTIFGPSSMEKLTVPVGVLAPPVDTTCAVKITGIPGRPLEVNTHAASWLAIIATPSLCMVRKRMSEV